MCDKEIWRLTEKVGSNITEDANFQRLNLCVDAKSSNFLLHEITCWLTTLYSTFNEAV